MAELAVRPIEIGAARARRRAPGAAVLRLAAGLVILLIWQGVVGALAPAYVAKPSGVIAAIPEVIVKPEFLDATAQTLVAVAEGLGIALALGTVIGLVMGRSIIVERSLRHYVNGFYAVPMIVVLPLVSLWFGYTGAARLATIVFAALFSIIINVADGAKSVSQEYLEVARSFRSSEWALWRDLMVPYTLPFTMTGVRQAIGRGLVGMVAAEFFLSSTGLGQIIMTASQNFDTPGVFASILIIGLIGVGLMRVGLYIEARFARWRH